MPAIIPPGDYDRWLSSSTPEAELVGLLKPYPANEIEVVPVSPAVNSVRNDGPECLTPAA
jgi:putative SOS response-associated peptidase YedK